MSKETPPPVPTPTPADIKKDDWENKFFEKHGITDDDEKAVIRGRARVLAYRDAQRKAEEAEENATPDLDKKKKDKAWWKSE